MSGEKKWVKIQTNKQRENSLLSIQQSICKKIGYNHFFLLAINWRKCIFSSLGLKSKCQEFFLSFIWNIKHVIAIFYLCHKYARYYDVPSMISNEFECKHLKRKPDHGYMYITFCKRILPQHRSLAKQSEFCRNF